MTGQELNRDVKRLYKFSLKSPSGNTANWSNKEWQAYEQHENEIKTEFLRLYRLDQGFELFNRYSILVLIELNRRHRVVAFHTFGANVKL